MTEIDQDSGFLKTLRDRLALIAAGAPAPDGPEAQALLPLWPASSPSQRLEPATLPACDYLAGALELGMAGPESGIATGLPQLTTRLRWTYGYPPNPRYPGLKHRIAFTEVLGTTGIWPSQQLLLGFTLIAPHTHYPAHAHPAIELYLVVAGAATWRLGDAPGEVRPPGSVIVHPSGAPHAMTTGVEPLLALFTWRGDLVTSSSYV
jgi:mannose-6-phosphate isomerase-like protein (cupin superfamily)